MATVILFVAAGCSGSQDAVPTAAEATATATPTTRTAEGSPASYVIRRGDTLLRITDQPGPLFDYNAPLPPPGTPHATHPFLSGSCEGGDIPGCGEARRLLEASKSTAEFLEKLRDAGFTVEKE